MDTVNPYRLWQLPFHDYVSQAYSMLSEMRRRRDRNAFDKIIEGRLSGIRRYVSRRIDRAEKNGLLPKGQYQTSDIINQLYVMAYDHFDEVLDQSNLYKWLFEKADGLLEDAIIEKEFQEAFFEDVEKYSKKEWEKLEERYTVDAGGDLVMEEDLDEHISTKNDYVENEAFVEELEEGLITKLQNEYDADDIDKHIDTVLLMMPDDMSRVFELYINQGFNLAQTSEISKISYDQTDNFLKQAKKSLVTTIGNRFL